MNATREYLRFVRHLPVAIAANVNQNALRDEITRLATLGYDGEWLASIATVGIADAKAPAAVLLTRLRDVTEPAPKVVTAAPPNLREKQCPTHLGERQGSCRGCRADAIARTEETT